MKTKKWQNYTLSVLLTLIVLVVVAGAGVRVGMTQNASIMRPSFTRDFDGSPRAMQVNPHNQAMQENPQGDDGVQGYAKNDRGPQSMQGNFQSRGLDTRRDGGFPFLSPIFGLIRIVALGLLLWVGYTFVKRSGWRLSFSKVAATPQPVAESAPVVEVEEKKDSE